MLIFFFYIFTKTCSVDFLSGNNLGAGSKEACNTCSWRHYETWCWLSVLKWILGSIQFSTSLPWFLCNDMSLLLPFFIAFFPAHPNFNWPITLSCQYECILWLELGGKKRVKDVRPMKAPCCIHLCVWKWKWLLEIHSFFYAKKGDVFFLDLEHFNLGEGFSTTLWIKLQVSSWITLHII